MGINYNKPEIIPADFSAFNNFDITKHSYWVKDAADLEDSAIAKQIDTFGYGKLAAASIDESEWDPATKEDYISLLNSLRATLFNKDVVGDYR